MVTSATLRDVSDENTDGSDLMPALDYRRLSDDRASVPRTAWAILAGFALVALTAPAYVARVVWSNAKTGRPLGQWFLPEWFAVPALYQTRRDWSSWLEDYELFAVGTGAGIAALAIVLSCVLAGIFPRVGRGIMLFAACILLVTLVAASWRESSWAFSIASGVRSLQFEHVPWQGIAALGEATWLPAAMIAVFATRTLDARRRCIVAMLLSFGAVLLCCTICGTGVFGVAQPLRSIDRATVLIESWPWAAMLSVGRVERLLTACRFIAAGVVATLMLATGVIAAGQKKGWQANIVITGTILFVTHLVTTATLIGGATQAAGLNPLMSSLYYHDACGPSLVEATRTGAGAAFGLMLVAAASQRRTGCAMLQKHLAWPEASTSRPARSARADSPI